MPMTDVEARIWLALRLRQATARLLDGDVTAENDIAAFEHVLTAMDDRAAIVRLWFGTGDVTEVSVVPVPVETIQTMHTARKHTRGEP